MYAFTTRVCYTRDMPTSIAGMRVRVVAPAFKVHACVTLPLVGTVHKCNYLWEKQKSIFIRYIQILHYIEIPK